MEDIDHTLQLRPIVDELPTAFDDLGAEASGEGHRFVDRLAAEWAAGQMRFDGCGEMLLAGYINGELAGIGGLTIEPAVPGALRMRRFYVRPSQRRSGVGRRLALALLERAEDATGLVTVNAQRDSFPFWESLGFRPDQRDGRTHAQNLGAEHAR